MGEHMGVDPSLTAGATILPHMERLHSAMGEILPLLENENEAEAVQAAKEYVARRAQELSASDPGKLVGKGTDGGHGTRTFIGPDTSLSMTAMGGTYHLDDLAAYEAAFLGVRANYAKLRDKMPPDKAYLNAVVSGANYGQAAYFEGYFGNDRARRTSALDIIDDDAEGGVVQGPTSIAGYKGMPLCLERSAVTHDTLLIYGVDSKLHAGHIDNTAEDGTVTGEDHAFLTFPDTTGNEHILDPTNPVVAWNQDGTVAVANPAIYKCAPGADRQAVELKEYNIVDGQAVPKNVHKLTYTFDPTLA
jgi:hypothetical protein